ncbi:hypothetical protein ACP70R_039343 [Stipagrostis hirtigluma subsp. patula]
MYYYFDHTDDLLQDHAEISNSVEPSLDARMEILGTAIPELVVASTAEAIVEWGSWRAKSPTSSLKPPSAPTCQAWTFAWHTCSACAPPYEGLSRSYFKRRRQVHQKLFAPPSARSSFGGAGARAVPNEA